MTSRKDKILLAFQLLIAVVILGLSADASTLFYNGSTPSSTSLMTFDASWTILVCLYLLAAWFLSAKIYLPIVGLILSVITSLFWWGGWIWVARVTATIYSGNSLISFDDNARYVRNRFFSESVAAIVLGAVEAKLFLVTVINTGRQVCHDGSKASSRVSETTDTVHHHHQNAAAYFNLAEKR